ncbi:MAG TPA: NAD(P)H-hydrate dehydratase, partial [Polyangia bacterium]
MPDGARGKEGRGGVCIVGGCLEIPGAVLLASVAALRAGAGRLQIATVRDVAPAIAVALPEARVVGLRQRRDGELDASGCREAIRKIAGHDAVLIGP